MRRSTRGMTLVFVLMVLTALTVIVASFAASQRIYATGQGRRTENLRANRAAESGLARAMQELTLLTTDTPVTLQDEWALLGQNGNERFVVGRDSFRVEIVDASARVNLNNATQEQLYRLPLTTEQVDALMDWREAGNIPRQEGAKDEYYTSLDQPYITAMKALLSFDELLLVKGFDMTTLYEPPTEDRPNPNYIPGTGDDQPSLYDLCTVESESPQTTGAGDGTTKLNINNVNANQIAQRGIPQPVAQAIVTRRNTAGTFTRLGEVLQVPGISLELAGTILDNFIVGGANIATGKININTAPSYVLSSIPGITQDIADGIVSRQSTGYLTLGEITTVPGVTLEVLQQSADAFTILSRMFFVRVIGTAGRTSVPLQAVVVVDENGPRVLKRIEPPYFDMRTYWRWSTEPTADVVVWEGE